MKKTNQFALNLSAGLTAGAVTLIVCLTAAAVCYADICAKEAIPASEGVIYPFFEWLMDRIGSLSL